LSLHRADALTYDHGLLSYYLDKQGENQRPELDSEARYRYFADDGSKGSVVFGSCCMHCCGARAGYIQISKIILMLLCSTSHYFS
jgi:hypothetical protein